MTCPICGKETVPGYRPFCSKRCADRDLGKWLSGSYALPAQDPEMPDDGQQDEPARPDRPH